MTIQDLPECTCILPPQQHCMHCCVDSSLFAPSTHTGEPSLPCTLTAAWLLGQGSLQLTLQMLCLPCICVWYAFSKKSLKDYDKTVCLQRWEATIAQDVAQAQLAQLRLERCLNNMWAAWRDSARRSRPFFQARSQCMLAIKLDL